MEVEGPGASFTVDTGPRRLAQRTGTFEQVYSKGASTKHFGKTKSRLSVLGGASRPSALGALGEESSGFEGGQLTVVSASFNLTNSIVGAGMVGLAFVTLNSGIIPFVSFMIFAGVGSILTLDMLAAGADMAGFKDFERIGISAFGKAGKWASGIVICTNCYSFLIGFIVIIRSTAPVVAVALGYEVDSTYLQIGIAFFIILPLCILKSLESLACSAMVAIFIYVFVVLYILYSAFTDTWYVDGEVPWNGTMVQGCPPATEIVWIGPDPVTIMNNLPTIIFAYVCQMTAPPVFSELEGGKVEDMNKVNRASIGMAFVFYTTIGLSGYFAFGSNTFPSVLLNLRHCVCVQWSGPVACMGSCLKNVCKDDNNLASFLCIGFLFAVVTGFPTVHFSVRKSLVTMFVGEGQQFSWGIHIGIAVINILICLSLAILAGDNINTVFNWSGAVAGPAITFILPCLFFLALLRKNAPKEYDTVGVPSGRFLLIVGVVMTIVGIVLQTGAALGLL